MNELPARRVIVPFAVALDDFDEMIGGGGALAARIERDSEIVARLMVGRIGGDPGFQFGNRADRLRLLGEIDGGLGGRRRGGVALGFRGQGARLVWLLEGAGGAIAAHKP